MDTYKIIEIPGPRLRFYEHYVDGKPDKTIRLIKSDGEGNRILERISGEEAQEIIDRYKNTTMPIFEITKNQSEEYIHCIEDLLSLIIESEK